jgi:Fe-S oxidoreductase
VKQALDLCLACKGCKSDCPAGVDMATYKAEFLSHYYEHHLRPRTANTLGLIFRWARLASRAPDLVNFFTQTPGVRSFARAIAGVAPKRRIPAFASETFVQWFRGRPARRAQHSTNRASIILWPDTFSNYFHPEVARAAVEVLEDAGFQIALPPRTLCCGRPLYDYGRLDQAKGMLRDILDVLRPQLREGAVVVGLEPSCIAVFRDELPNLFPDDPDALHLSQNALLLGECLQRFAPDYAPPKLDRRALVHVHCHQKALMGAGADVDVLGRMGVECQLLDSGCCGMAGAFGFEREHYDVSLQIGERVLLPAVRKAPRDTLVVTNGFSCSEQIEQATGRRALHLAEVMQLALHERHRAAARRSPDAEPG